MTEKLLRVTRATPTAPSGDGWILQARRDADSEWVDVVPVRHFSVHARDRGMTDITTLEDMRPGGRGRREVQTFKPLLSVVLEFDAEHFDRGQKSPTA